MSLRDVRFFAGARLRATAGAAALGALIAFFARGRLATSATGVAHAYVWGGKQFNEAYTNSARYMSDRH